MSITFETVEQFMKLSEIKENTRNKSSVKFERINTTQKSNIKF